VRECVASYSPPRLGHRPHCNPYRRRPTHQRRNPAQPGEAAPLSAPTATIGQQLLIDIVHPVTSANNGMSAKSAGLHVGGTYARPLSLMAAAMRSSCNWM
jgi:hypothetical protein